MLAGFTNSQWIDVLHVHYWRLSLKLIVGFVCFFLPIFHPLPLALQNLSEDANACSTWSKIMYACVPQVYGEGAALLEGITFI